MVSSELRLALYCIGLLVTFSLWSVLQERIAFGSYVSIEQSEAPLKWKYPVALNLAMAAATYFTASVIELIRGEKNKVPLRVFW